MFLRHLVQIASAHAPRLLRLAVLLAGVLALGRILPASGPAHAGAGLPTVSPVQNSGPAFARFSHSHQAHQPLACLLCHQRNDNAAVPRWPGHSPCAGCHSDQFANNGSPVCAICHSSPPGPALKSFPRLRSFGVRFDHARHRAAKCATCHTQSGRGTFSTPVSFNAHSSCFQCHSAQASRGGRDISSCGTCHTPGRFFRPGTPSNGAAQRGFSHNTHTKAKVSCNECHTIRAGAPRGRQVSVPPARQHERQPRPQTCGSCHNNQRAFGGYDFGDCKRCHNDSFGFIRR